MKSVNISHKSKKNRLLSAIASTLVMTASYAVPAFPQIERSPTDYKVILYDAETIARINTKMTSESASINIKETVSQTITQETHFTAQEETSQIIVEVNQPLQLVQASTEAPAAPSLFPRDISSEFVEIVEGVPIMKDPQSCGKGLLEIGVTVENVASDKGTIVADLHDDVKENFLVWDKVVLRVRADAKKGETTFCMPLTKPGEYSIAIYHDKNNNKKFDKNFLGIPSEHFGMSNNPKFGLKSPEYEQAAFTVPETGSNINIRLLKAGDILGGQKR